MEGECLAACSLRRNDQLTVCVVSDATSILYDNQINGTLPASLGDLTALVYGKSGVSVEAAVTLWMPTVCCCTRWSSLMVVTTETPFRRACAESWR